MSNRCQARLTPDGWAVHDRLLDRPMSMTNRAAGATVELVGLDIGSAHRLADEANLGDWTPDSWLT